MNFQRRRFLHSAAGAVALVMVLGTPTVAAELKTLFPGTLRYTANEVIPEFEKSTAHKVTVTYSNAGVVTSSIERGVAADVAVTVASQVDELQKQGKIVNGSSAVLAKVGAAVFVRKGEPKPDISSVAKLRASLLAAKSIVYTDPGAGGPVGIYVAKLLENLGIAEAMKPKTKLAPGGEANHTAAVNGEAELGFNMLNEIMADSRVDLVGPLPGPVQDYTVFAAGLVATSAEPVAARNLITFLSSPAVVAVLKRRGFELP